MKPTPGLHLGEGKYQLLHRLGAGSQAEVWEAKQVGLAGFSKHVVLKCMNVSAVETEHQHLMLREARLAASIHHPNIVEIYDVGSDQDLLYLAMEHIQGRNLETIQNALKRSDQQLIPWELVAYIAIEVCKALYHAHTQAKFNETPLHIVHRDLKPSNILISQEGYVKVIDFGIAKATHPEQKKEGTHAGRIKGTPAYMSPEQITANPIDARSDLFSLGTILYELFTGQSPFHCEDLFATLVRVVHEEPPKLSDLRPDIPKELAQVVERLLAKKPEERFQNARAARRVLESILRGKQIFIEQEDFVAYFQKVDALIEQSHPNSISEKERTHDTDAHISPPVPTKEEWAESDLLGPLSGVQFDVVQIQNEDHDVSSDEADAMSPDAPTEDTPSLGTDALLHAEEAEFKVVHLDLERPTEQFSAPSTEHLEKIELAQDELFSSPTQELAQESILDEEETPQSAALLEHVLPELSELAEEMEQGLPENELDSIFASLGQPTLQVKPPKTSEVETSDSKAEVLEKEPRASKPLVLLEEVELGTTQPQHTEKNEPPLLQSISEPLFVDSSTHSSDKAQEAAFSPAQTIHESSPTGSQVEPLEDELQPPPFDTPTRTLASVTTQQTHEIQNETDAVERVEEQQIQSLSEHSTEELNASEPQPPSEVEQAGSIVQQSTDKALQQIDLAQTTEAAGEETYIHTPGVSLDEPKDTLPPSPVHFTSLSQTALEVAPFSALGLDIPPAPEDTQEAELHPQTLNAVVEQSPDDTSHLSDASQGSSDSLDEGLLEHVPSPGHVHLGDSALNRKTYEMLPLDDILGFDPGDRTMTSPPPQTSTDRTAPKASKQGGGVHSLSRPHLQEINQAFAQGHTPNLLSTQPPLSLTEPMQCIDTPTPIPAALVADDEEALFGVHSGEKTALTTEHHNVRSTSHIASAQQNSIPTEGPGASISKSKNMLRWMIPIAIILLGLGLVGVAVGINWK